MTKLSRNIDSSIVSFIRLTPLETRPTQPQSGEMISPERKPRGFRRFAASRLRETREASAQPGSPKRRIYAEFVSFSSSERWRASFTSYEKNDYLPRDTSIVYLPESSSTPGE